MKQLQLNTETNSSIYKKIRKKVICDLTGKCPLCPWHKGENYKFSRKPRTDKYKNKR